MTEEEALRFYREAYERERKKNRFLNGRLADEEYKNRELEKKLADIKGTLLWRLSKPLRSLVHWVHRTKERVGRYGDLKGVLRKLNAKGIERKARTQHGTASFPDAEEARRQRETRFDRSVRFSILVPLYNTPEKFLRQAIESVTAQTYSGWELCLADGSDAEHAEVGQICMEY